MRIDLDDLMTQFIAAPFAERVSPRHFLSTVMGIDIVEMTISKRRVSLRVTLADFDLRSLAAHVLVLNKRDLMIFTLANTVSEDGDRVLDIVYAGQAAARAPSETEIRAAAAIAADMLSDGRPRSRLKPMVNPILEADPSMRPDLSMVSANSVLIEEEDPTRLAYLVEEKLGSGWTGDKRHLGKAKTIFTDRATARL